MMRKCAVCESEGAKLVFKEFRTKYNQTPVSLPKVEMYECSACGEDFFTAEQANAISMAVKREIRNKAGLLSPEEIIAIRKGLGLTQGDLEELFGLGAKVVTRWENGHVLQSKAADVALRLLAIDPHNLERLREIASVTRP